LDVKTYNKEIKIKKQKESNTTSDKIESDMKDDNEPLNNAIDSNIV
jgi:hypothetical protein